MTNKRKRARGRLPNSDPRRLARNMAIVAAYRSGGTLRNVGQQFGVSHQRVRQILARHDRAAERQELVRHAMINKDILELRLDDIDWAVRIANALKDNNLIFVRDLLKISPAELLSIPNFGRISLREVEDWLHSQGLHLNISQIEKDLSDEIKEIETKLRNMSTHSRIERQELYEKLHRLRKAIRDHWRAMRDSPAEQ
jgi:Bacterial RNA polymerase, alpha chain C terminal domain